MEMLIGAGNLFHGQYCCDSTDTPREEAGKLDGAQRPLTAEHQRSDLLKQRRRRQYLAT